MTLPDRITKLIADAAWSRDNAAGMTLEREEVEALAGLPDLVQALVAEAVERKDEALHRIVEWADAYPPSVFPEPDFAKAAKVLADAGLSLDAIAASSMRHVVNGVREIASAAIRAGKGE